VGHGSVAVLGNRLFPDLLAGVGLRRFNAVPLRARIIRDEFETPGFRFLLGLEALLDDPMLEGVCDLSHDRDYRATCVGLAVCALLSHPPTVDLYRASPHTRSAI
jgi:hypothetical protein